MMVNVYCVIVAMILVLILFVHITNLICGHHRKAAIKALTGMWADYDHVPYQMATDKFEAMQNGLLVVYDEKNLHTGIYQLDRQAAEDWFDAIKAGHVDWLGNQDDS